jgi:hypothetical protein
LSFLLFLIFIVASWSWSSIWKYFFFGEGMVRFYHLLLEYNLYDLVKIVNLIFKRNSICLRSYSKFQRYPNTPFLTSKFLKTIISSNWQLFIFDWRLLMINLFYVTNFGFILINCQIVGFSMNIIKEKQNINSFNNSLTILS